MIVLTNVREVDMSKLVLRVGLCLLLSLSLMFQPIVADVLQTGDSCAEGRRDGDTETSGILWFVAGCGLGILGVVGAYLIKPTPPAAKLVGKSPDYVAAYSDCYRDAAVSVQTKWAWIGCGSSVVLWLVYFLVIVAAATTTVASTP